MGGRFLAMSGAVVLVSASLTGAQSSTTGVTIAADRSQCGKTISVQVWSLVRNARTSPPLGPSESLIVWTGLAANGGPLSVRLGFITGEPANATCRWTVDDLVPGEVTSRCSSRPQGREGRSRFPSKGGARQPSQFPRRRSACPVRSDPQVD